MKRGLESELENLCSVFNCTNLQFIIFVKIHYIIYALHLFVLCSIFLWQRFSTTVI